MNELLIDDVYYWSDDMLLINEVILNEILKTDDTLIND
jgi:hypothetical protein